MPIQINHKGSNMNDIGIMIEIDIKRLFLKILAYRKGKND